MGVGIFYAWGAGGPASKFPVPARGADGSYGYDCSGLVQAALVKLGLLSATAPDRSANELYRASRRIQPGAHRVGDLAFYGAEEHVDHVGIVFDEDHILEAVKPKSKISKTMRPGFLGYGRIG